MEEGELSDALTGLLNRRAFYRALDNALASYSDGGEIVAMILADLNGFKHVNDTFGHVAGDEVLKSVAGLLRRISRNEAVVCRYAGDEFIALCTATTESRAQQLAVRIETEVASLVVNWEGQEIGPTSISTGLAYCPRDGRRAEDLIRAADFAMFRKKRGEVGTRVYELIDGKRSVGDIVEAIVVEFDIERETAEADVRDCIAQLPQIEGDDDPPTTPMAVTKRVPKPRPPTDARATLTDHDS